MFNNKLIENWVDSTFKTDQFYNNLSALQLQFINNYQAFSSFAEESNKKAKEYWESQAKAFNMNTVFQKAEEIRKLNEENYAKVKAYVEENSKTLNSEQLLAQIKQATKSVEESNLKMLKLFEKNTALASSDALWEQVEKVNKAAEEAQKKALAYFSEQYEFWKKFQNELSDSMKSEDPTKAVPEAVKKYAKAVANANLKKIDESLEKVKQAVA